MPKQREQCGIKFTPNLLHPRHWLTWFGLGLFFFVSLLPTSWRHFLGHRIGNFLFSRKSHKRRYIVDTNLRIAFPKLSKEQREAMVLEHFQWYGCAVVDYSVLFFSSKKRLSSMLQVDGREYIDQLISENKNVIILLAHSVMLEFGPAAIGFHYDSFGSYKTSKNPVMDWIIAKSRCRHVSFVVSREEGLRKLVKSLAPNKLMIFLPDEDLGAENSTFAPFFHKQKATLTTTARIAKMGKAQALTAFTWFDKSTNKYRLQIQPVLQNYPTGDAIVDATKMNQSLEKLVEQHPAQYIWTMKLYRTRPENDEETIY